MTTAQLQQFFQLCDPDGNESVDRDAFRKLCNRFEITDHDADVIFDDLDHDGDGRISFEDFSRGFSDFLMSAGPVTDCDTESPREPEPTVLSSSAPRSPDSEMRQHVWAALTAEAEKLGKCNKESRLKWLLDELQSSEKKHLVPYLETAVEELLSNLHRLQEENEKLEKSWKREKLEHERHVKRMADEMDNQVQEAEMKLRMQAQAEVEDERRSLQSKMDAEMDNLQAHLALFDKVNSWLQNQPSDSYDARLEEVRNKLNDAVNENRQLRISLLDTQTSIALMRSELLQLRTLYEEKCRELSSEREKILEVLQEQDHLTRQLSLLHDANKRLQDTNDALRCSFEQQNNMSRVNDSCELLREKSGSIIGDYIDTKSLQHTCCCAPTNKIIESEEVPDECFEPSETTRSLRRARSLDVCFPPLRKKKSTGKEMQIACSPLKQSETRMSDAKDYQDRDEGFYSTPDSSLLIKEEDKQDRSSLISDASPVRPISASTPEKTTIFECETIVKETDLEPRIEDGNAETKLVSSPSVDSLLKDNESELPKRRIADIIKQLGFEDTVMKSQSSKKLTRGFLEKGVNADSCSKAVPVPLPRQSLALKTPHQTEQWRQQKVSTAQNSPGSSHALMQSNISQKCSGVCNGNIDSESLVTSMDEELDYVPNGPADKMFNVIFIGDAGVGKSSFALRISKGVFMRHMSATLGVDFLMRTIRVDNCNVELRLWDTAGQERFRSVTTSYFRKADGVMLLYDCTCEQTYLNVRQWVKDVDVSCFYRLMAREPGERTVTAQNIPLMIVGNKIDLRPVLQKSGRNCISREQGEKLAKDCGASFAEASAKDGTNVLPALVTLVRCMLDNQELQSSSSTMQLSEGRQKKSGCCGK